MSESKAVPINRRLSALVARVSLEQQAKHGYSLPAQVAMLTDVAEREGFGTHKDFILFDDGFSGDDWDRPAINRALQLIRDGKVHAVAFLDCDRFSRDVKGGLNLIAKIHEAGGDVIFGDIGRYRDDANFELQLNLKLSIAQFEKAKIRHRSQYGTAEKIRQGKPHGGRGPYGFRFITKAEGGNALVVVPEEARIVVLIFEWADEGWSMRKIARRLIADGVPPPHSHWNPWTVAKILRDETYVGTWYYNKHQAVEPDPKRVRKPEMIRHRRRTSQVFRPKTEWMPIAVEAIVDPGVFARVQARIENNKNCNSGRPSDRYGLKSLVWCGQCGKRRNGWLDRQVARYVCNNRDRLTGQHLCGSPSVRAEVLDALAFDTLKEIITNGTRLEEEIHAREKELVGDHDPQELIRLRGRHDELKRREFAARRSLLDTQAKGDAEAEEFYQGELRDTVAQRLEIRRQIDSMTLGAGARVDCKRLAAEALRGFDLANRSERQQLLQTWVSRVTYHDHEAEIELRIPVESGIRANCQQQLSDVGASDQ